MVAGPAGGDRRGAERAFAGWLRAHPAIAGLRARIGVLPGEADGPASIEAARPLIEDARWAEEAIAELARAASADPWFEPPLRALDHDKQRGLIFHDDGRLRISVQAVPLESIAAYKAAALGRRSVGFTGALTLFRVVRAAGTVLDLWQADPAGKDFAAARAGRCRPAGQLALQDGMIFTIDGRREAWTIARQQGDMLLVQATARLNDAPLAIEYDAGTGAFLSASATDGAIARLQLMATLLRLMRRADAAPAIAALAEEGPFFLRWHMARELVAIDRATAGPVLRRMAAGDPHAEIRAAANRTLALIAA
jgi:hypothetical protein